MFWIVDSLLMWKKTWSDKSLMSVHYHRRSPHYRHHRSPRYKQLSSSDSEATAKQEEAWPPDNNPVYVDLDSDPSGSQELTHPPSPPR